MEFFLTNEQVSIVNNNYYLYHTSSLIHLSCVDTPTTGCKSPQETLEALNTDDGIEMDRCSMISE